MRVAGVPSGHTHLPALYRVSKIRKIHLKISKFPLVPHQKTLARSIRQV